MGKRRGPPALSEEIEPEASTSAEGVENPGGSSPLEDVEGDASEEAELGSYAQHQPREKGEKYQPASVESSPGRRSPSPERLQQILSQRRLHLQPLSPEYVPPSPDNYN